MRGGVGDVLMICSLSWFECGLIVGVGRRGREVNVGMGHGGKSRQEVKTATKQRADLTKGENREKSSFTRFAPKNPDGQHYEKPPEPN